MKLLFLGDLCGRSGRDVVTRHVPQLCGELQLDVLQLGRLAGGGSEAPKGAGKHMDSGGPEREPTVN